MAKYYAGNENRIAVVDWDNEETEDNRFGDEIDKSDLPDGFDAWTIYERFAHHDCTVAILSEGGE